MKRSTPHFTFEVKRSRLPSHKTSTFQRFIVEPKPTEPAAQQNPLESESNPGATSEIALSERRVLPSIVESFAPEEPSVAGSKRRRVIKPRRVVEPEPAMASLSQEAIAATVVEEDPIARPAAVLPFVKRQRAAPKTVADLPRSQKWKRRLPRVAW
ncbi:hypothetical protein [Microvirga sp. VF16]|uniref:hypothetical protein n=1 Tax=Microvirga sp. VF16 TaxID=2807101 RepID=UPI00193CD792|nr:hypothetical protein [Microvirga sp. VF16]QRM34783.1 hypothetical protein JO965_41710 [Microvirga sp. VF16]